MAQAEITNSQKAVAAHALESYFNDLAEQFCSTPPLRRITPSQLRPDILKDILVETYRTIRCLLPDKRVYNSVFRKTFKPLVTKVWADYPSL
jgi:hypothetical protein